MSVEPAQLCGQTFCSHSGRLWPFTTAFLLAGYANLGRPLVSWRRAEQCVLRKAAFCGSASVIQC